MPSNTTTTIATLNPRYMIVWLLDADFQKKRREVGKKRGIAIWGPVDPPEKRGIHGTYVAIDWDICIGCAVCLEVSPQQLHEWMETPGHPTSEKKAFPANS